MYGLKKLLEEELARLQKLEKLAALQLESLPEGTVRVSESNHTIQYYYRGKDCTGKNGRYLRKSEEQLAYQLAQRNYAAKLQGLLVKRIRQLKGILSDYAEDEVEQVFHMESSHRQKMITPLEMLWEQRLEEWKGQEYLPKSFRDTTPEIYADKGHRVRSKSEKILADYFFRQGIPYHYEKPLYLQGFGTVYPDFTFFSEKYGGEIYWEHEGMLDNPEYARKAIRKLESYEKNGIFPGERLILTRESSEYVLNTSEIERKVCKYLKV